MRSKEKGKRAHTDTFIFKVQTFRVENSQNDDNQRQTQNLLGIKKYFFTVLFFLPFIICIETVFQVQDAEN